MIIIIIIIKQKHWFIRESEPQLFGLPVMLFLPKNGFTAHHLYHAVWNLIQFRYLAGIQIKTTTETMTKKYDQSHISDQQSLDQFNSLTNNYYYIFGNSMQQNTKINYSGKNILTEMKMRESLPSRVWWAGGYGQTELPFVLKRVDLSGKKCYRCSWDKYCSGCVIPYKPVSILHTPFHLCLYMCALFKKKKEMGVLPSIDVKIETKKKDDRIHLLDFDENKEYLAIDWDESFFKCFLQSRIEKEIADAGMDANEIGTALDVKFNSQKKQENTTQTIEPNDAQTRQKEIFQRQLKEYNNWNPQFSHHTQLLFENVLEHSSVQEHIHLLNKFDLNYFLSSKCLYMYVDSFFHVIHQKKRSRPISIGDCIREYQKEEKQPEFANNFCCHKKNTSIKSHRIWSTPPVLIFHLKRNSQNGGKINTHVEYLLKYFDMAPFLVPRTKLSPEQFTQVSNEDAEKTEESKTKETYPDMFNVKTSENVPTTYHLFGVVVCLNNSNCIILINHHYGRSGGGHYVANCLCRDLTHPNSTTKKWYLFDDHRVRQISSLDVKSKTAYLLFYLRSDYCDKDTELMEYFIQQTKVGNMSCPVNKSKEVMNILSYLPDEIKQMKKLFESEGMKDTGFMSSCAIL
ncbi:Ubiquitin carboxyl-terminal hydrolase family protein [Reticulomyxa filosa]|uniref:Ubiquitin carboxyl-terminal hydrolase family protein n=1 Tax=Reticulomyxa filosa TaxID=46433 RepID=X6MDX5_RETFI|nr:Ubiquitin carboxyl-terminal hydrolase family protein [Reticulomyxa filosa]|eukprot:ETO11627.1 Ubiquitin carboxyl-terminal hydrolase family protein [Reticulomyxa filosa]